MSLKLRDITINSNGVKNKLTCSSSYVTIPSTNDLNLNSTNEVVINPAIDLLLGANIHNCNRIEGGSSDLNFFVEDYTNSKSILLKTNNVNRVTMNNNSISFQNIPSTATSIVAGSTSSSLISMATFLTNIQASPPLLISSGGGAPTYNTGSTYTYYTRIANTIFTSIRVTVSDITGLNPGNITISLPFTAVSDSRYKIGIITGAFNSMNSTAGIMDYYGYVNGGTDYVVLTYRNSQTPQINSESILTKNELTNVSSITFSVVYFI